MKANFRNTLKALPNEGTTIEVVKGGMITYKKVYDRYTVTEVKSEFDLNDIQKNSIDEIINKTFALEFLLKQRTILRSHLNNSATDTTETETPKADTPKADTLPTETTETTEEKTETTETPKAPQQAPKVEAPNVSLGLDALIGGVVKQAIEQNAAHIDIKVQEYLDKHGIRPTKTNLVVTLPSGEKTEVGQQHEKFEDVLSHVVARIPALLVGAPATGKSFMCRKIAEALKMRYAEQPMSGGGYPEQFFGFVDANGNPTKTTFQDMYQNGGLFLLDELDNGNPNTTAALNNAIANESAMFAEGMINKHENFAFIATANTYGNGATNDFAGRNPIDKATLDRFDIITIDYCKDLEFSLTNNHKWVETVRAYRHAAQEKKIRTFITPRATINGAKLLSLGMDKYKVIEYTILKGMNEDERNLLKDVKPLI